MANTLRKKKKLPLKYEKFFDNGSSSYYIENHLNGTDIEMLEHFVDLMGIPDENWEFESNRDKLIVTHPDYLEYIVVTPLPSEQEDSTTYYYLIDVKC